MTQRSDQPRLLVIGGTGVLGSFVATSLESDGAVHRASRRPPKGGGPYVQMDIADKDSVDKVMSDGYDLVVNCVHHPDMLPEKHVLDHGGKILNVATLTMPDREALAKHTSDPKGVAVLHGGLTPGLNTLLAADLVSRFPDSDELRLVMTESLNQSVGPQCSKDFAYHLLTSTSSHAVRGFDLLPPFGTRSCIQVSDGTEGAFGGVAGSRETSVYFAFWESWFNVFVLGLNKAHLLKAVPSFPFTMGLKVPDELSTEPKRDQIMAYRNGEIVGGWATSGTGDYRLIVAACRIFAMALHGKSEAADGAYGVEELFEFEELRAAFEAEDFTFSEVAAEGAAQADGARTR